MHSKGEGLVFGVQKPGAGSTYTRLGSACESNLPSRYACEFVEWAQGPQASRFGQLHFIAALITSDCRSSFLRLLRLG